MIGRLRGSSIVSAQVTGDKAPTAGAYPVGLPSLKGELANSALAMGWRARPIWNFSVMSASLS